MGGTSSLHRDEVHEYTDPRTDEAAAEPPSRRQSSSESQRWRAAELERAGPEASAASLLATRMDVDLHFAIDLLRNGCAPELALQILLYAPFRRKAARPALSESRQNAALP